ncbi:hypothetical protein [Acinetobacter terrae]|uniref:hypothetical protein n=1 Tax=Acinetobacter terrae TaxID=2731247 RepID=UPI0007D8718E|nr:hypothetical protein [Acinetobacter terrae]OAL80332.1 hypothetical protein AY608_05500 [Acinetobacter terrae]
MTDIKTMRDKLNGSLPFAEGENEEMLREEWNRLHTDMESLKAKDERNYVEFHRQQKKPAIYDPKQVYCCCHLVTPVKDDRCTVCGGWD